MLSARVLDRGVLSLAGARVAATLPDDVKLGDALQLRVQEAGPDGVVLQIVQQPPTLLAATAAIPLPGGAYARLIEDEDGAAGGARGDRSVVLRYDSPTLGRLDIGSRPRAPRSTQATARRPMPPARPPATWRLRWARRSRCWHAGARSTPACKHAAALRYDDASGGAPRVVAAGSGELAERIIALAVENGVPIRDDAGLARLLARLELEAEVPRELWAAVAEALVWAYRLTSARAA